MNYVRGEKIRKEIVSIWCRLINSTSEQDNEKTETTTFQSMIESGGEETTTVSSFFLSESRKIESSGMQTLK